MEPSSFATGSLISGHARTTRWCRPPVAAANTLICLTNQACYLLKRQLERLEQDFLAEGGFTERLYAARQARRRQIE